MMRSASRWRSTASCISAAVVTRSTVTPGGESSAVGPLTNVTRAPRCAASRAIAYPIFPEDRLLRYRTGSTASRVGPAVTSTCLPDRPLDLALDKLLDELPGELLDELLDATIAVAAASIASGSGKRPSPT